MYTKNNKQRKGKPFSRIILIASIVAFGLGGCAVNEKDSETKPDPVIPEEQEVSVSAVYKDTINEYVEFLNGIKEYDENAMSLSMREMSYDPYLDHFGYAFMDINKDGVDELLIGSYSEDAHFFYDMYVIKDGKAELCLKDDSDKKVAGYSRDYYAITNDNKIYNYKVDGEESWTASVSLFDGSRLNLEKKYRFDSFEDVTSMEWNLDTEQWQETTLEALNVFSNTYSMDNFKQIHYKPLSEIK